MEHFLQYWVALSSLDVMVCAWSYYSLVCHVHLMSLGDLLFSEGRWELGIEKEERLGVGERL